MGESGLRYRKTVVLWDPQGPALYQQIDDNWVYLFVYLAAMTKNHKRSGLNNRHGVSHGLEGQKFKIKSSAGMILPEAGRENLVQTSLSICWPAGHLWCSRA